MKKIIDELRKNIGKRCILQHIAGSGGEFPYSGEILDVYDDGFIKIKTYDNEEIFCNLIMFQTIKIAEKQSVV